MRFPKTGVHRLPGREGAYTLSYDMGLKTMHRPLGRQREDAHCPSAVPVAMINLTTQSNLGEKRVYLCLQCIVHREGK